MPVDDTQLTQRIARLRAALDGPIRKGAFQLLDAQLGALVTAPMQSGVLGPTWSGIAVLHTGRGALAKAYTQMNNPAHLHEETSDAGVMRLVWGIKSGGGGKDDPSRYAAAQEYGAVISANPLGRAKWFAAQFFQSAGGAAKAGKGKERATSGDYEKRLRGAILSLLHKGEGVPFWGIMALSILKKGTTQLPARMHVRLAVREFNSDAENRKPIINFFVAEVAREMNAA